MAAAAEIRLPAWEDLSQAERDAAYDNNAAVADSAAWVEARNRAAAEFRTAHAGALDLAYGPEPRQKLDLYVAADAGAPCLFFIHGGYWQRNSREVFAHYAEGALASGWSVAMPSHTLAPEAGLTRIVEEIGLALDWLSENGAAYGVAGPIVIAGWSAGAHLAVLHLGHPAVVAGLAVSGVYELAPIAGTFLNAAVKLTEAEIRAYSPLRLPIVPKPLAIAYGSEELPALAADSERLYMMRRRQGASGGLLTVPGAHHFSILEELRKPGGELVRLAGMIFSEASQ